MSTASNRREFLTRCASAAGGVAALSAVAGAPALLLPRKARAQSSFPSFNTSGLDPSTLAAFQSQFCTMANDVYSSGSTSASSLSSAQSIYAVLAGQLQSSGFNSASVSYIAAGGGSSVVPGNIWSVAQSGGGLDVDEQTFLNAAGDVSSAFEASCPVGINDYGVPDCHWGGQCSLSHWALVEGGSAVIPRRLPLLRSPDGSLAPGLGALNRPAPPPSGSKPTAPGPLENFCWWLDWAWLYMGVMAIPLGMEGAAFPPLGFAMGAFAVFAPLFQKAFC